MSIRIVLLLLFIDSFCFANSQSIDSIEWKIDAIIDTAIQAQAFPGCIVYASSNGEPFFFKSYGFHTYDSLRRVARNDIYDLASITKVTAATLALMKLYEEGLFDLDDPIGKYVEGIGRKIGGITFRECLAHQAGLRPWIPYYQEVKKSNGTYKRGTIGEASSDYDYKLSDSLYLHKDFYLRIKKMIKKTKLSEKTYRYSGLFFYLVPEIVKNLTGENFDSYLSEYFYDPLGAETLLFNPTKKYELERIVPTELDNYFRMEQIHGTVHDEGAITMRGISGNAGLFSTAEDLARLWHMLLQDGMYDTTQYLRPETIQLFTTTQYPNNDNRRGLGFDKPLLTYDSIQSSVAKDASFRSFGHSGYTGTLVWGDPQTDLLFIFLTNRVYPSREYRNIYKMNVRPRIHQLLYDFKKKETY